MNQIKLLCKHTFMETKTKPHKPESVLWGFKYFTLKRIRTTNITYLQLKLRLK